MAVPQELERFVRDALAAGVPRPQVESTLAGAGWSEPQVREAMAAYADLAFPVPVPRPRAQLSAREAFEYLLLFATLYLTAWHLGSLLFDLINHALPDAADPRYRLYRMDGSMRWSIAGLVVAFPVFAWLARHIGGDVARHPVKRLSPVRRWLTYLTLFIAAAVLIGDLVALVYNVLGGETSLRFVLKVLVVAAIASAVFGYYLSDLRRDEAGGASRGVGRGLVLATAVAVVATVATAIAVTGSPSAQRQARLDERRVQDLRQLEAAVTDYARREGRLPDAVDRLPQETGRQLSLDDPAGGGRYGYEQGERRRYRLCAVFATDTRGEGARAAAADEGWRHPAGRHCFERAVPAQVLEPGAGPDA